MFTHAKLAGSAWRILKLSERFNATLTEEQAEMIAQLQTMASDIAKEHLPEEMQPVISYVFDPHEKDAFVARLVGGIFHPATRQTFKGLFPQTVPQSAAPMVVSCRKCGHVAQYGLELLHE